MINETTLFDTNDIAKKVLSKYEYALYTMVYKAEDTIAEMSISSDIYIDNLINLNIYEVVAKQANMNIDELMKRMNRIELKLQNYFEK